MKELLLYMAKSLVDDPDSVTVTEIEGETTVLELRVAAEDMGKLIGRSPLPSVTAKRSPWRSLIKPATPAALRRGFV